MPIKGCWSRASTAVLGLLTGVVRVVRRVAVWVVGNAATVLGAIRERHRERMLRDPSYRTAIGSGRRAGGRLPVRRRGRGLRGLRRPPRLVILTVVPAAAAVGHLHRRGRNGQEQQAA